MELRAGYKQTEVGMIPEDWEIRSIGDTMKLINGRAFKPSDWKESGVPIIRIQNLNDPDSSFNFFRGSVEDRNRVDCGDLLFAWSGTKGTSFGARIWSGPTGVLNQHIFKIIPDTKSVTLRYSYLVLLNVQEQIEKQAHGFKASFVHVKKSDLVGVQLPLPPNRAEQDAIATALSDVDTLLAKIDQLIAKKRDLKQAAMQQLLTGQTRLPGFSGEWDLQSIEQLEQRNVLRLGRGKVISKQDINRLAGENPIYSSSVHNEGLFGKYSDFMFDEELITWSVDGGGHFFHRQKHKFSVTNVCGYMRAETAVVSYRFLALQLQFMHGSMKFDYSNKAHPSVIRKAYVVPLPPLSEQTAIATVLSDMDAELAALEARRDKTRALKQGMMQALLTGRIRLVGG